MGTKRILLTPGEPAGIGPELCVRIAQESHEFELTAICDAGLLSQTAEKLGLNLSVREISEASSPSATPAGEIACIHSPLKTNVEAGRLDIANADYVVRCLQLANDLCLAKSADAIVTGPVQKSIINDAGIPFSGHTEFFAEQSQTEKVVMMLSTEGLRVALVTTHIPLRQVADAITYKEFMTVSEILYRELIEKFGISQPKVLVCGLNPHAGEGGHLGEEEITTISPAIEELNKRGMKFVGPLPADTLFTNKHLETADAVLAMYHDQGLPVLKYKGFGNAVNITLGLPYIRTSVDHGTALDLAGLGVADLGSMKVALENARLMANSSSA